MTDIKNLAEFEQAVKEKSLKTLEAKEVWLHIKEKDFLFLIASLRDATDTKCRACRAAAQQSWNEIEEDMEKLRLGICEKYPRKCRVEDRVKCYNCMKFFGFMEKLKLLKSFGDSDAENKGFDEMIEKSLNEKG